MMRSNKLSRLPLALLFLVSVIAVALLGCQAPTPTASPTAAATTAPAKPTTAPAVTTPVAPAVVTPSAAVTPGAAPAVTGTYTGPLAAQQVLRLNLITEPPTLDANKVEDTTSAAILTTMYEGLVRYRPDLTVEPAIAQSWSFSNDGKTITFKLRDAKWSDGTPLTAKDFEYSWKRLLDPRTASPYTSILTENVVGAKEFNEAKVPTDTARLPQLEAAIGAKAVDDKTFQVDLKAPASYFLTVASIQNLYPINRSAVEKGGDKWTEPPNHISNGPFVLKSWQHQSKITLEPNPNYWDVKPTLTRIEMSMITDEKAAIEAYKNNELDISSKPPDADIPALRADAQLSKEVVQLATLGSVYIGLSSQKEPFAGEKGKLVRQAFSQAIDRQALVDVVLRGIHIPAMSFIPPGAFGHQANIGFKFDPAAARATLQKAGYADGKALGRITFLYNSPPVPGHKPAVEFIADQLNKNLGVEVEIRTAEPAAYLDLLKKDTPNMFRLGWNADYPHPNAFLNMVFNSTSTQNYGKYNNSQFDKLVTDASREPDQKKQEQLYNQAQQLLVDDAGAIFLYYTGRFRLAKPWVKDLFTTPLDPDIMGIYFLRLAKLAQH